MIKSRKVAEEKISSSSTLDRASFEHVYGPGHRAGSHGSACIDLDPMEVQGERLGNA